MALLSLQKVMMQLRRAALVQEDDVSDGQLLAQFTGQHDEAAFAALVKRHGSMVLGVCRRLLGNVHDADDAFQATFLILVHKAATLESCELVGNWLYGVAYNTALAARAKNARKRSKEKQVVEMPEPAVMPPDDWSEMRPLLDRELSQLADVYREAIVLCDLEGKSRKEAARKLGIPEGTMSSRLTTARRQLARRLTRRGVTLSGGAVATLLTQSAATACVPVPLAASTIKAAAIVAAGSATTGAVSASVAALTEGVLTTMFLTKVKTLVAVLVAFAVITGLALIAQPLTAPVLAQDAKGAKGQPDPAQTKGADKVEIDLSKLPPDLAKQIREQLAKKGKGKADGTNPPEKTAPKSAKPANVPPVEAKGYQLAQFIKSQLKKGVTGEALGQSINKERARLGLKDDDDDDKKATPPTKK